MSRNIILRSVLKSNLTAEVCSILYPIFFCGVCNFTGQVLLGDSTLTYLLWPLKFVKEKKKRSKQLELFSTSLNINLSISFEIIMLHHHQAVSSVKVGVRVRPLLPREKNQPLMISVNDFTSLQFKNSVNWY